MVFDLDEIVEKNTLPFDCKVSRGGVDYAMRRSSDEELDRLRSLGAASDVEGLAFLQSLFSEPAPDLMTWSQEQLQAAFAFYGSYHARWAIAHSDAITKAAMEQARRMAETQGGSARP